VILEEGARVNGAEVLVATALQAGVEVCFANPGTTELPLVAALDGEPGVRPVLGLFEGVVTGAADGYARMTAKPALTLLHLGPGFANGIANLHNARRAYSPIVNIVGDHATWHRPYDAPLTSDIESLARPVSGWVRQTATSSDLAADVADAIAAARSHGGQVATLVVPADCQWGESGPPARPRAITPPAAVPDDAVRAVAKVLSSGEPAALMLGAAGLTAAGLRLAGRIASATGCRLFTEKSPAQVDRGADLPAPERLAYFPEDATRMLGGVAHLILAGARPPVTFFAYPEAPSSETPAGTAEHRLAAPRDDVIGALAYLADLVGNDRPPVPKAVARPELPGGELDPATAAMTLAAMQPAEAIVVNEATTMARAYFSASAGAAPHTVLSLTGGAIGQGLPSALGAAIACPDRPVIAYQADGSALCTSQALWTMARERLDVTVLILSNRRYRILEVESERAGVQRPGAASTRLTQLDDPAINWVSLANGYGVDARSASTTEELESALTAAFPEPGPHLVEVVL